MTYKDKDFREGVCDGVFLWLQDHPVSLGEAFEEAIKNGVKQWLNAHSDEIIAAIAERATK